MATMGKVTVGRPAPEFKCRAVVDGRLKEISLDTYREAQHWLILVFFPRAWSFICPTEIRAFSARLEEFLYSRHCAVVFASTDNEHCLKAWNATSELEGGLGGVHVPLISDCNHELSRNYGVLIEEEGVAQRALFIIDKSSVVRNVSINDADVGRSVDEALRILDALSFKDEFGEGCPVDWKRGQPGLSYAKDTRVEGLVELKKSWSEWARPKLTRTWSAQSGRSITSVMPSNRLSGGGGLTDGYGSAYTSAHRSASPSRHASPLCSPTSGSVMEKEMNTHLENTRAALSNQQLDNGIGVAN